ncbi:hypothetical protein [Candidatus Magnetominusculus dajiuhuensis]|uniref:hypothetical protein n=1 Tax=Candidatus Magnetominusculus dajiuhuensis TaxID=3137712 RepID=UPI003B4320BB
MKLIIKIVILTGVYMSIFLFVDDYAGGTSSGPSDPARHPTNVTCDNTTIENATISYADDDGRYINVKCGDDATDDKLFFADIKKIVFTEDNLINQGGDVYRKAIIKYNHIDTGNKCNIKVKKGSNPLELSGYRANHKEKISLDKCKNLVFKDMILPDYINPQRERPKTGGIRYIMSPR